jgi:hypothetical protein
MNIQLVTKKFLKCLRRGGKDIHVLIFVIYKKLKSWRVRGCFFWGGGEGLETERRQAGGYKEMSSILADH